MVQFKRLWQNNPISHGKVKLSTFTVTKRLLILLVALTISTKDIILMQQYHEYLNNLHLHKDMIADRWICSIVVNTECRKRNTSVVDKNYSSFCILIILYQCIKNESRCCFGLSLGFCVLLNCLLLVLLAPLEIDILARKNAVFCSFTVTAYTQDVQSIWSIYSFLLLLSLCIS